MIDLIQTSLGWCMAVGIFGLPICKLLHEMNFINDKVYKDLKFAFKIVLIIGFGSAVTVAVFENFYKDFIEP